MAKTAFRGITLLVGIALTLSLTSCKKNVSLAEWHSQLLSNNETVRQEALKQFPAAEVDALDKSTLLDQFLEDSHSADILVRARALDVIPLLSDVVDAPRRTKLITLYLMGLQSPSKEVRIASVRGAAGVKLVELLPFIQPLVNDADPAIRKATLQGLVTLEDPSAPDLLAVRANHDSDSEVATLAMQILKDRNWPTQVKSYLPPPGVVAYNPGPSVHSIMALPPPRSSRSPFASARSTPAPTPAPAPAYDMFHPAPKPTPTPLNDPTYWRDPTRDNSSTRAWAKQMIGSAPGTHGPIEPDQSDIDLINLKK